MNIESEIYKFAKENDILIGICSVERFDYIKEILEIKRTPFTEQDVEKRINPLKVMSAAKSIIVIGVNYNKAFKIINDNVIRGRISINAVSTDYHHIVNEKLEHLKDYISKYKNFEYKIFTDTGPLVDRELAKRSGLGWQGKNCSVISNKFGSFFSIGYMITDMELKYSIGYDYNYSKCNNCDKCIKACPNGALSNSGFDYKRCVSYLTQTKDNINFDTMINMKNNIYGCDICQLVCPYNKGKPKASICDTEQITPPIESILNISNREFNIKFKNTAAGWRGKKILQRNCIIALGNSNDIQAFKIIKNLLNDERIEIKYAVVGALRNLKHKYSVNMLEYMEKKEENKKLKKLIKGTIIYLQNNSLRI